MLFTMMVVMKVLSVVIGVFGSVLRTKPKGLA